MAMPPGNIHPTADVADSAIVARSARVWHYSQLRDNAVVGENCIIGRGVYIGDGVELGDNCKIQNYAMLYEPAHLGNGVFVGPSVVLTNDQFPRAVTVDGTVKSTDDWDSVGVTVLDGASVGAGSICIAPVTIGKWALVGAGSVVSKNVPDFALVVGNPARRVGWVGKAGHPLTMIGNDLWECPKTSRRYTLVGPEELIEVSEQ
jgi:UDP-2-acetamido-3-amino-2,3-dideoxy-glucuronate N-acetyltransferase